MYKVFRAVDDFKKLKGVVVGDLMLDVYSFGSVERISPEAPVPVVKIERVEYRVGGAANVANNVKTLGAKVFLAGILGDDYEGDILLDLLSKGGIDLSLVKRIKRLNTIVKNRIVSKGQQLLRIDVEESERNIVKYRVTLLEEIIKLSGDVDFIIVEDYNKGLLNSYFYRELISNSKAPVFIDPKYENYSAMKNAYLLKPNFDEFRKASGVKRIGNNILRYVDILKRKLNVKNLVVTKGEDGMFIEDEQGSSFHIPSLHKKVFDVTGAGDMVISILALGMSSGLNLFEASILSTIAAGIEITKLGAQPVSIDELNEEVNSHYIRIVNESNPLKVQD